MNERLQELAKQANFDEDGGHLLAHGVYVTTRLEKFAELIVLETCNVLDKAQWDKGEDWVCADDTRIIPHIKQHFGVKE
jgi:hypothetical protein